MTLDEAVAQLGGLIEPSVDERANGWTPESLSIEIAQQRKAQQHSILNPRPVRAIRSNHSLKWA